ncbi:hypothetical protein GTR04_6212 [Trichophyton interdigitale]|nr:hypothetical protein GY631_6463 [Trichophyton interdigitale]KAG5218643.1 hypothetical protein GY632_5341 [Trichophyton interdigitale]KAG8206398.1 hypothetical protein GTR04_6212 [Trichophyton interdigitale]
MSIISPSASAKKAIHKIDIAQVSLNLQDRLGLAKVRYERLHGLRRDSDSDADSRPQSQQQQQQQQQHLYGQHNNGFPSETGSDCSSSDSADARYSTPFTSSPVRSPMLSKELPRSARSRHAATFDIKTMQCMTSGGSSRKRRRCDPAIALAAAAERDSGRDSGYRRQTVSKMPRLSFNGGAAPHSSPLARRQHQRRTYQTMPSFVSETDTIPDPDIDSTDIDPQLSSRRHHHQEEEQPCTPPPRRSRFAHADDDAAASGSGADLLLYLANSPTPATINGKPATTTNTTTTSTTNGGNDFLPSTPPTQHAAPYQLLSTPTPSQPFNFADFVNVTPSPAQRGWSASNGTSRTPLTTTAAASASVSASAVSRTPRTPRTTKDVRKRLNFDALAPPSPVRGSAKRHNTTPSTTVSVSANSGAASSAAGLALQLGEELPI